jgi:two-component system sensor histidine kinase EvgS
MIEADGHRVRQILGNLLSNAIKYTEQDGVTVKLETREIDSQSWAQLKVMDTGIGIASDLHGAVFAEYVKVHSLLNKSVKSTGLGLPIAKRLVEMHGGTINLESQPGQGSIFTVRLPIS